MEVKPALSINLAVTVLGPSPLVRFQVFVVVYGSQFDHVVLSFEKLIWFIPEVVSVANMARVIVGVVVIWLVVMLPAGGVLSNFIPWRVECVKFR
jgi:hypothetical protein